MRRLLRSMHKRWHFLLFAAIWGYFGFALATMNERTSIYQYQPFTLLTLFASIGGGALYNGHLYTMKRISFLNLVLSIIFWSMVAILVAVSGVLIAKHIKTAYQINVGAFLGFPL